MPAGVVKNKADEAAWNRAKAAVRKEYPDIAEDSDRFWKLTNSIFQDMSKARQVRCVVDVLALVKALGGVDSLEKAHVEGHWRTTPSGQKVWVTPHERDIETVGPTYKVSRGTGKQGTTKEHYYVHIGAERHPQHFRYRSEAQAFAEQHRTGQWTWPTHEPPAVDMRFQLQVANMDHASLDQLHDQFLGSIAQSGNDPIALQSLVAHLQVIQQEQARHRTSMGAPPPTTAPAPTPDRKPMSNATRRRYDEMIRPEMMEMYRDYAERAKTPKMKPADRAHWQGVTAELAAYITERWPNRPLEG